jgi:hypothetical protein
MSLGIGIGHYKSKNDGLQIQIQTTSINQQVSWLGKTGYNYNGIIDYGDGTSPNEVTSFNDINLSHSYDTPGIYIVTFSGLIESLIVDNGSLVSVIQKVINWGSVGLKYINFNGCSLLSTTPTTGGFGSTYVGGIYTFAGCTNLTYITPTLLKGCSNHGNTVEGMFRLCYSLTNLPSLEDIVDVTNFKDFCFNCRALTSLPIDLLRYNTDADNFQDAFAYCLSLTSLPTDLFRYNTSATNFYEVFRGCTSLTSLPADLFRWNTSATNFYNGFNGCTNLNEIPITLFDYNLLVTTFYQCFYNCESLTGDAPSLWLRNPVPTGTDCFYNCLDLDNYADIPAAWK